MTWAVDQKTRLVDILPEIEGERRQVRLHTARHVLYLDQVSTLITLRVKGEALVWKTLRSVVDGRRGGDVRFSQAAVEARVDLTSEQFDLVYAAAQD